MKKIFLVLCILPLLTHGQDATIHFDIKNTSARSILVANDDYTNPSVIFGEPNIEILLTSGKGNYTFKLVKPIFIRSLYWDSANKINFIYTFYLSPGDDLNFSFDAQDPLETYTVAGTGSQNNQPLIQNLIKASFKGGIYRTDSIPHRVLEAIKRQNILNQDLLKNYITRYQPTTEFVNAFSLFIQYYPLQKYIGFKDDQKYNLGESYYRNEKQWEVTADSLMNAMPIGNTEALNTPGFASFLYMYLVRTKERIWKNPELVKAYFFTDNATHVMKEHSENLLPEKIIEKDFSSKTSELLGEDPENLLQEKIIEKHFSGKPAEFLYASLFKRSINETEDNIPEIFARFKQKYPHSEYIPYIEPDVQKILQRRERKLTNKMTLVQNPASIRTLEDVLHLMKGKTVLLDMWGTWCGPCRSELLRNSDSIKNHFKDQALDYLYIANRDIGKEAKWKELISYYNLTGTHILASINLTNDIMAKVKSYEFPTYVIIKRNGTFELSKAGHPMDRNVLYKQLEDALK